ncbi:MAG: peptidase P60 [Rhizobiales bacterium]|nr:peptidase P60 [Hyphomicrobiales bacterium]
MGATIVAVARTWKGTPYRHQASRKGLGCDCLGLIRGVWRELAGAEPERLPPYTPSWAEDKGQETMRDAALRHMREVPVDRLEPGDVLLFRVRRGRPAKHAAIAVDRQHIIHAYGGHAVEETPIPAEWRDCIAYAFAFPWVPA